MKTVIMVSEENHGFIGLVEKENRIVDFLISQGWLNGNTLIDVEDNEDITVDEYLGSDWENQLKTWDLFDLSIYFESTFLFTKVTVFE